MCFDLLKRKRSNVRRLFCLVIVVVVVVTKLSIDAIVVRYYQADVIDVPNRIVRDYQADVIDAPNRIIRDYKADVIDVPNRIVRDYQADVIDVPNRTEPKKCQWTTRFKPHITRNWIQVSLSNKERFVYSAFLYEIGGRNVIRVLGVTSLRQTNATLWCYIWSSDSEIIVAVAKIDVYADHHNTLLGGTFFTCNTTGARDALWVSIVDRECAEPTARLPLHKSTTKSDNARKLNFTVCFPPLYGYSDIHQLISTIEINRILGAEKMVFYNTSIDTRVNHALQTYISEGIVDVHPWTIRGVHFRKFSNMRDVSVPAAPAESMELHYIGQNSAINDCVYRYRSDSEFLIIMDMDEHIVPKQSKSLAGFIKTLSYYSSYRVRSSFFKLEFPDTTSSPRAAKYRILPLQKMYRENYIFPHKIRPKSIIRPQYVDLMGVHQVFNFRDKTSVEYWVKSTDALVHHYRMGWWGEKYNRTLDSALEPYDGQIVERVSGRWNMLCGKNKTYCL